MYRSGWHMKREFLLLVGKLSSHTPVGPIFDNTIYSDDVTTESVQYYTVKSKFTVSTLTCLDHLAVREDCECDVKQCVIKVCKIIDKDPRTVREHANKDVRCSVIPDNTEHVII